LQKVLNKKGLWLGIGAGLTLLTLCGVALAANNDPLVIPNDPEQSTTMSQRVAQRESTFKVHLSATQQQGIKSKCTVAQTGMQNLLTKDIAATNNRRQVYSDLAAQLATIIDHLKRQSIDTNQVVNAQKQFNDAINAYLTDSVTYKTAMDDSIVIDCVNNPVGFEASLLASRQLRGQLAVDVAKIKTTRPALTKVLNNAQQALIKSTNQKANQ